MKSTTPCRVLVLEDHPSLRRNLVALLEDEDFIVAAAGSGEEALALIAEQDFQVAIVDVRLPGISGIEWIEQVAHDHPHLGFLIHTGSVDYVVTPEIAALGIGESDVFFKPISDLNAFFSRIRYRCGGDG
ncbi:response regulator [uncultured Thiodictyon sp.]|uniref:response regulator n=1 Tax=uncultured Thiodictyon sp. TaxID=1846217 RepID=UPI0025F70E19|nr:response regulator [uncultured Thiodictyon sp.]